MGNPTSNQIIIACWIILAACEIFSASRAKPTAERQSWLGIMAHRVPLLAGCVLLVLTSPLPLLNKDMTPHQGIAQGIAVVVRVLGLFIGLWSRWTLGGNWSSAVTFKQGHELIKTGPYRLVRHPIYTGILLMCLGTGIEIGQFRCWLGLPIIFASFWIKLRQEESLLMRRMPDEYPAYRNSVKALVPFLI